MPIRNSPDGMAVMEMEYRMKFSKDNLLCNTFMVKVPSEKSI